MKTSVLSGSPIGRSLSTGVLLITNTEPDETVMVDGLNITPGVNPQRGGTASVSRRTELETARDTVSADFTARAREKTHPRCD